MKVVYDKILGELREGAIPLETANGIFVNVTSDAKTNGANLIAAYAKAKALTPNGASLATDNRACVIVPPARYDLDHTDAPAPSGITITPDAVGANPVTWYYRMTYGLADGSLRSLISDEDYFTIGDDTTEIIVDGGVIPDWAEASGIILGTTSGYYDYITNPNFTSFPSDIFGAYMDLGMGNLYPLALLQPVHQDCTPLTLDTEFVDIIGLTTDRSLQYIYGTPEATNSGVIVQTANDVHISNLTVEILTDYGNPNLNNTDSAAYFPSTNMNNTKVENVYFKGNEGASDVLFSMRLGVLEYSGTFTNCKGGYGTFGGGDGIASGTFTNCTGGENSFGGNGTASGTFTNCKLTQGSYSSATMAEGSTYLNCIDGYNNTVDNNKVTVNPTADAKDNGARLIAAYATAKALTPNGSALATDNRACVIIPPGNYDLDPVEENACVPLTLDTEFVDIIGLTTDRDLQYIYGTPEATNSGVIIQTANDVHISNLYVKILTEVESVNWDNTDSAAYFPSTNLSNTVVENCQFDGEDGNNSKGPRLFSMRLGELEYSGTFTNCIGGGNSFGSFGIASGIFNNCIGENDAFGGGEGGIASGTFNSCTGGHFSFGSVGTASGTFTNCTGGGDAFGGSGGTASGTFTNCTGGPGSFGKVSSGTFNYCIGGDSSFGSSGIASGIFSFCKAGEYSFGEID